LRLLLVRPRRVYFARPGVRVLLVRQQQHGSEGDHVDPCVVVVVFGVTTPPQGVRLRLVRTVAGSLAVRESARGVVRLHAVPVTVNDDGGGRFDVALRRLRLRCLFGAALIELRLLRVRHEPELGIGSLAGVRLRGLQRVRDAFGSRSSSRPSGLLVHGSNHGSADPRRAMRVLRMPVKLCVGAAGGAAQGGRSQWPQQVLVPCVLRLKSFPCSSLAGPGHPPKRAQPHPSRNMHIDHSPYIVVGRALYVSE
jgi:hypothetical protein